MTDLDGVSEGDIVILHGCCHNPSGIDLDQPLWEAIATQAKAKNLICLVDFPIEALAGLEEDRAGLHVFNAGLSVLVAVPQRISVFE